MSTFQGANQIVQYAVKRMQQNGAEQLNAQVDNWMQQIATIMNTLISYQAVQQSTMKTYAELARSAWESSGRYSNVLLQKDTQVQDMLYQQNIEKAYHLINSIGETVRGSPIQYSLILNGVDGESGYIEWSGLNINQFLQVVNIAPTSGKMRLQSANMIHEKLQAMQEDNITLSRWSTQKEKAYEHFKDVLAKRGTWTNLKEGQQLEAFAKYYRRKNKNDNMILDIMEDTLSDPDAFWQNGDDQIGQGSNKRVIQYKANDASVTQVDTLVAKLDKVYAALANIKGEIYNHAKYAPNQGAVGTASMNVEGAIEKLVVQFINNNVLKALAVK